jgi:hypothetical protein
MADDATLAAVRSAGLAAAFGLNAGPVKLAADTGRRNVIGDGVGAALATAAFADAHEILASRAFRDTTLAECHGIDDRVATFALIGLTLAFR